MIAVVVVVAFISACEEVDGETKRENKQVKDKKEEHEGSRGRQVAQSVERRTLEAEIRAWKPVPVLGIWWWGRIPSNQPCPKGAAPAATTLLAEW